MKKLMTICMVVVFAVLASSAQAADGENGDCTTIQEGTLTLDGEVITVKKDVWGYNYQARLFDGLYCDSDRVTGCDSPADEGVRLLMKWNDAWLSNKDCDGDGLLDRHLGFDTYIGSGAWVTNVMSGSYMEGDEEIRWNYFCKMIAVPSDAYLDGGIWYTADHSEIGPVSTLVQFAITQEVYNDLGTGEHGLQYLSEVYPGVGNLTSEVKGKAESKVGNKK